MELKGKNEEKKRKAYPGIPILGSGASGSGGFSMGVAQVGGRSVFAKLSGLLTSPIAIMATVTAAFTISGIGLSDMHKRGVFENGVHLGSSGIALRDAATPAEAENLPGTEPYSSSLEMASKANAGALGSEVPAEGEEAGETGAEEETAEADGAASLGEEDKLSAIDEVEKALADGEEGKAKAGEKEPVGKLTTKLASSKVGGTLSLGSGGGMSSGIGRGFDPLADGAGRTKTLSQGRKAQMTRSKTSARGRGKTSLRGATAKRLSDMNRAMGSARKMGAAEAAAVHNRQWTGAADTGRAIGGAGTGVAGGGPTTGEGGAGLQNGGPLNSSSSGADAGGAEDVKKVGSSKNVTPWQKEMDLVMILLPIASLLLLISYLLAKSETMKAWAQPVAWAAAAVAAIVTVLGVMIISQGQMMQGGMITAIGGLLTFLSVKAAMGDEEGAEAEPKTEELADEFADDMPIEETQVTEPQTTNKAIQGQIDRYGKLPEGWKPEPFDGNI